MTRDSFALVADRVCVSVCVREVRSGVGLSGGRHPVGRVEEPTKASIVALSDAHVKPGKATSGTASTAMMSP